MKYVLAYNRHTETNPVFYYGGRIDKNNIYIVPDTSRAFIYTTMEDADRAIKDMHLDLLTWSISQLI